MKLNWKDRLKDESNHRLFELFSEKKRINIDPQIFAGNLLFERKYDLELLKNTKKELIESINDAFKRKYNTEPQKIKKENIIKELVMRTIFALAVFGIIINSNEIKFEFESLIIDNKIIAIIMGALSFIPLIWLKKSNENTIKKVERESLKKNNMINKINSELRF
ncbi:MAG: hypothetical protein FD170_2132 [Bacteroidetes bacterium]|nr:MAG: hypothetical protein FD170_2132 [Bacteroidota bacterium]